MPDKKPEKTLDRRLNAYRPDLADARLAGRVAAERVVEGEAGAVTAPVADLRPKPDMSAGIDTQLLFGETLRIFERRDGWAWVQAETDGYVGYMAEGDLVSPAQQSTHWIIQPRTFVYPEPDMKRPRALALSLGSRITVIGEAETRGTRYLLLAGGGSVIAAHCVPVGPAAGDDYVAIAARLLETPYLWGGKSAFGIDCSGLVQLSMLMAGKPAPRDSDMQAAGLGAEIGFDELRRGDLVFWKGHVAIMEDEETMIHANGHTMSVAREGLKAAVERIGYLYGKPTVCRRP
ncbi:cell wall-associated NlpC family hydrolase [Rhizobium aquaticum]|uniref:Cell wall-associated NlpC family hydrolase n=1 Tax=Rhizobium aquaticum TaxID=1549636 RepID=A0ABV2IZD5_9HYPH